MWYSFLQFWARIIFPIVFRIRVFGRENVPAAGGVILASNHQSFMDPPFVGVGLNRQVHYMARKSLFHRNALFTGLIRSLNAFPVERDRGDVGAVRETFRRLKDGAAVLVFPEGTRTRDGGIGQLKPGVFAIAVKTGAPVVPTVIDGAYEAWPRTRLFPRPRRVRVLFGEPLFARHFGDDPTSMAEACRGALVALQDRLRGRSKGAGT